MMIGLKGLINFFLCKNKFWLLLYVVIMCDCVVFGSRGVFGVFGIFGFLDFLFLCFLLVSVF